MFKDQGFLNWWSQQFKRSYKLFDGLLLKIVFFILNKSYRNRNNRKKITIFIKNLMTFGNFINSGGLQNKFELYKDAIIYLGINLIMSFM